VKVLVGCVPPVAAAKLVVGRKPPWNQPQLRPAAVKRSPTFLPVLPETRLIAPGVDGPDVVPKESSLMAKFWASFHEAVTVSS
jgi:hypothetical protein